MEKGACHDEGQVHSGDVTAHHEELITMKPACFKLLICVRVMILAGTHVTADEPWVTHTTFDDFATGTTATARIRRRNNIGPAIGEAGAFGSAIRSPCLCERKTGSNKALERRA